MYIHAMNVLLRQYRLTCCVHCTIKWLIRAKKFKKLPIYMIDMLFHASFIPLHLESNQENPL